MDNTLTHINKIFAESVEADYKRKRYGIKTCRAKVDADFANDVRELLNRSLELEGCGLKLDSCGIQSIKERINTL